jgi:hypothetical protein
MKTDRPQSLQLKTTAQTVRTPRVGPSIVLLGGLLGAAGCSFDTAESPYGPSPAAPFTVTAAELSVPTADPQPLNPTVTLTFSDFPDPGTVQFPALRLGPRGTALEYLVETRLVERQLTLRPRAELLPENDYYLQASPQLRALSGQPLPSMYQLRFRTGTKLVPPPPTSEPPLGLADVLGSAGGLRARCASPGCHSRTGGQVPARGLDLSGSLDEVRAQLAAPAGSLVQAAGRPGPAPPIEPLRLVQPGAPEKSYLLRKLLAHRGFTRITGDPMPPPPAQPLDEAALRVVQGWIRQGAL